MINVGKIVNKVRWIFYSRLVRLSFRIHGYSFGSNFKVNGHVYVKNLGGKMTIGNYVRINSSKSYNPIGGGVRTNIELLPGGCLKIGNKVGISNASIVCSKQIYVGDYVNLGDGVKIFDTDFHALNPFIRSSQFDYENAAKKKVYIDDYAFIGTNVTILKGSRIGRYSVIGAGSIVTGNIPEGEIWAGNPACFIRKLTEKELEQRFI